MNLHEEDFSPKDFSVKEGYFPPPWNPHDFPQETFGWFKFQKSMKQGEFRPYFEIEWKELP